MNRAEVRLPWQNGLQKQHNEVGVGERDNQRKAKVKVPMAQISRKGIKKEKGCKPVVLEQHAQHLLDVLQPFRHRVCDLQLHFRALHDAGVAARASLLCVFAPVFRSDAYPGREKGRSVKKQQKQCRTAC